MHIQLIINFKNHIQRISTHFNPIELYLLRRTCPAATCPGYVAVATKNTKRSNDFGSIFPKTRLKQIKI